MVLTVVHSILRADPLDPPAYEWQIDVLLQGRGLIRLAFPLPNESAYVSAVEYVKKYCLHFERHEKGQARGEQEISGVTSDAR